MTRRLYKLNKQRKISGFFLCCIQLVTEEFDAHFVSRFDSFFGIGCIWHQCFFSCANEKDLRNKIPSEKSKHSSKLFVSISNLSRVLNVVCL